MRMNEKVVLLCENQCNYTKSMDFFTLRANNVSTFYISTIPLNVSYVNKSYSTKSGIIR